MPSSPVLLLHAPKPRTASIFCSEVWLKKNYFTNYVRQNANILGKSGTMQPLLNLYFRLNREGGLSPIISQSMFGRTKVTILKQYRTSPKHLLDVWCSKTRMRINKI